MSKHVWGCRGLCHCRGRKFEFCPRNGELREGGSVSIQRRTQSPFVEIHFFANHYSAYCAPPQPLNLIVAANKSRVPAQKLQLFPRILQLFSPNLRQMDFSLTRSQKIQSWGREGSQNVQKYKKYPHLYQQLPRVMHWRQGGCIQSNFALICITGMHFITLHSFILHCAVPWCLACASVCICDASVYCTASLQLASVCIQLWSNWYLSILSHRQDFQIPNFTVT